ncbi:hypothetical protein PAXRUDRAFT_20854 [Paxillus rubicundulus Ve08.2h10]|uniref:Uncharacterized protein n=1 Tax=Paxillus rubicundulus Ve08.2h10 TaxID=930991 RepID=A0A0D0BPK3_9AGAM|nr:hypothetical protein PAXRUDRAFT_20854 [Paxillus rubicundulus Ve08.2h10]
MEAGGSKLEGKQASDGNQGGKGGEKGKKKEKKEKKEKKIERVAKGSDGGQESRVGLNPGEKAKETVTDPIPIPIRGKGGLQFIPADQATLGAVKGSNPSPRSSKGSIPMPFQRLHSSIHSGDIEAAGYPLQTGPNFGTWLLPIKEGQGLGLQIKAEDTFGHPKCKIWPSPHSIPQASALELIATPINPLLDPQPGPSSDPTDQIVKALEVRITSLEKQVERITDLELQLSSMAQVVEALRGQVQGQLATHSFPTSSHRSLPLPPSVSRQM